jgi:hypothetical protein
MKDFERSGNRAIEDSDDDILDNDIAFRRNLLSK